MLTIMLDHMACAHVQVGNSLMAEVADIAVDTDSTWLLQFCALFLHVTSCKHCEELIISIGLLILLCQHMLLC